MIKKSICGLILILIILNTPSFISAWEAAYLTYSDITWSPDSRKVCFVSTFNSVGAVEEIPFIVKVDEDGANLRFLTDSFGGILPSPDRKKAVLSGKFSIWIIDIEKGYLPKEILNAFSIYNNIIDLRWIENDKLIFKRYNYIADTSTPKIIDIKDGKEKILDSNLADKFYKSLHSEKKTEPVKIKRNLYAVQVGAFKEEKNAENLTCKLRIKGYRAYTEETYLGNKEYIYRVKIGDFLDKDDAEKVVEKLKQTEELISLTIPVNGCYKNFDYSIDGTKIVFEGNGNIFMMDRNISHLKQLTTNGGVCPIWLADNKIVYIKPDSSSEGSIWMMNLDGTDKKMLINSNGFLPTWSPDGSKLLFCSRENTYEPSMLVMDKNDLSNIWVMKMENSELIQLTCQGDDPVWSLDGTQISFKRGDDKFVININGTGEKRMKVEEEIKFQEFHKNKSLVSSPDGKKIIYIKQGKSPWSTRWSPLIWTEIWIKNIDGTNEKRIINAVVNFPLK